MKKRYTYQTGGEQEQSWMDLIGSYIPAIPEYYNKIVNYFDEPDNFNEAFSRARAAGEPTFTFDGKLFNTAIKKEAAAPKKKNSSKAADNSEMFSPELLLRQGFMESRFRPDVVTGQTKSKAGAMGMAQLMPITVKDYKQRHPGEELDPYNPEDAVKAQKWMMNWLSERPYINKPGQPKNVTRAKSLAGFNMGPDMIRKFLESQKAKGVDIYQSLDWVKDLPEEPRKYVQGILLNQLPSFQQELERDTVNSPYKKFYGYKRSGGEAVNPLAQLYNQRVNVLKGLPKFQNTGEYNPENYQVNNYNPETDTYETRYSLPEITIKAKRPRLSDEIRGMVTDAGNTAFELSGLAGGTRFMDDPIGSLKGAAKTTLQAIGRNPYSTLGYQITPQDTTPFNPEDTEGFFNTMDAFGLASTALPVVKSALSGITQVGKNSLTVKPHWFKYYPKQIFSVDNVGQGLNLEELRRVYHNSERFLRPEEIRFLHKKGYGKERVYRNDNWTNNFTEEQVDNWRRITESNNQLPPPPSEIRFPEGDARAGLSQQQLREANPRRNYIEFRLAEDYTNLTNGLPAQNYPELTLEQNAKIQRSLAQSANAWANYKPTLTTEWGSMPKINKSGLTKEQALAKASSKDKDAISKMTEQEFEKTVLKPTGEVVPYYQGDLMPQFTGNNNVFALSPQQYVDEFNGRIDLLNEVIAKNNRSGVEYRVKELTPDGRLIFYTPEQVMVNANRPISQHYLDAFNKIDEPDFLYKGHGDKLYFSNMTGSPGFTSKQEAKKWITDIIEKERGTKIKSGESTWSVGLNPGQWRGKVEDIASKEYLRSIPGLEMRNTSSGVFSDGVPRRGTGAYESINEYLKKLDLGRVKPGFNSQTDYSRGAWENFIKSGRGVGFYGNPSTVYGAMKTMVPIGFGIGAGSQIQQNPYKKGGPVVSSRGQWDYPGQDTIVPTPDGRITMQGVPYPVYGQDETGYGQIMYPGGEYIFPGQMVYETPLPKAQNGMVKKTLSPIFNKSFKQPKNIREKIMRSYVDPFVEQAYVTADQNNIGTGVHNGPLDAIRHASAASALSSIIPSWMNVIPSVASLNFGLTNLAGLAHETHGSNDFKEHVSDLYNNMVGSVIGMLPVSHQKKLDMIIQAQQKGILSNVSPAIDFQNDDINSFDMVKDNKVISNKKNGGQMIRRADGSYSQRGLWDNIRANKGSGKKPTKEMLEQERKIKNKEMKNGGTNNAGFEALPKEVQAKILANMGYGGITYPFMEEGGEPNGEMALGQMAAVADKMNKLRQFVSADQNLDPWIASKLAVMDHSADAISDYMMYNQESQEEMMDQPEGLPMEEMKMGGIPERYKNMGFNKVGAKKDSTRPGKKWMVLAKKGDQYKVVHGGYDGMKDFSQHGSEKRKENFWNRMGGKNSAKATDPFSPLYWHKRFGTWQEGGQKDSLLENVAEIFDLSGVTSYDDVYRSYKKSGMSPETFIELLGAVPLLGKAAKLTQEGIHLKKYKGLDSFLYGSLPRSNKLSNGLTGAAVLGRGTDAVQAGQQFKTSPVFPFGIDEKMKKTGMTDAMGVALKNGGSTWSGNAWYDMGGYVPEYGMGGMPCYECGGMYEEGGPVVGEEMEVTPEQAEILKQMGYTFETI